MICYCRARIGYGQEELMPKEYETEDDSEDDTDERSSQEESSDTEDEESRCKPIFVRKKDRITVKEREREEKRQLQLEKEEIKKAEIRRRESLRMAEVCVKNITLEEKSSDKDPKGLLDVNTDDDNEEEEYEAWKLRELRRIKKYRDEKELIKREAVETERRRYMTDEERRQDLRNIPKLVTNKSVKGKFKFMQKYYHKGAFYMDKEEKVYKRDFSASTLEDHFDKTVLPKVMQVKNFGRSGRTKYTHLVDQDTTEFEADWSLNTPQNIKFHLNHAAGMMSNFERPTSKQKSRNL